MMIKDLSVSKELDVKAVSSLRGGFMDVGQYNYTGGATAVGTSTASIGGAVVAVDAANQGNLVFQTYTNQPQAVALFGSTAWAW